MDKIKTVKIKNSDGSVSEETYTISVDAKDVDMANGKELQETIGTIDIDTNGNISEQLENLNDNVDDLNINIKKKAYFFDTVADMKNANLKVGDYVCTLGYYEANDGGAGDYQIVSGNYVDDKGSYHKLKNNLYAKLIIINEINVKQFGAKGNGIIDDTLAFQKALSLDKDVYIPNGEYLITDNLIVKRTMRGEHKWDTHLIFKGLQDGSYAITLRIGYTGLNNFRMTSDSSTDITGSDVNFNGINASGKLYIKLHNLLIYYFNIGLNLGNDCWNNRFDLLYISRCNVGIYLGSECNDNTFNDCLIKNCKKGFYKIAGATVNINGGDFSYNEKAIVLENHGNLNINGTYFELNIINSIACEWGMSPFESIVIKDCSFLENNDSTRIFFFNGNKDSKAIIQNCFFHNVGSTNVVMCHFNNYNFKPVFIDNYYDESFTIDQDHAEYIVSKKQRTMTLTTNGISFTANGIGFQTYTAPTAPDGYKLISKEFIRTDNGSYNLIIDCPFNRDYVVYNSNNAIEVTGYISFVYINI